MNTITRSTAAAPSPEVTFIADPGAAAAGTYIFGDYCSGEIFAYANNNHSVLLDTSMSISSFGKDEAGELYVVDLGGPVSRIVGSAPPPPPCMFSLTPTRATFGQPGGTGSVMVSAGTGCSWTAESNASWISITGGASGTGNGTVSYTVAAYTGKPKKRNGTMTIARQTFQVTQTK